MSAKYLVVKKPSRTRLTAQNIRIEPIPLWYILTFFCYLFYHSPNIFNDFRISNKNPIGNEQPVSSETGLLTRVLVDGKKDTV